MWAPRQSCRFPISEMLRRPRHRPRTQSRQVGETTGRGISGPCSGATSSHSSIRQSTDNSLACCRIDFCAGMGEFLISRVEAGRRRLQACANPDSHTSYLRLRRKLEWMLDLELELGGCCASITRTVHRSSGCGSCGTAPLSRHHSSSIYNSTLIICDNYR